MRELKQTTSPCKNCVALNRTCSWNVHDTWYLGEKWWSRSTNRKFFNGDALGKNNNIKTRYWHFDNILVTPHSKRLTLCKYMLTNIRTKVVECGEDPRKIMGSSPRRGASLYNKLRGRSGRAEIELRSFYPVSFSLFQVSYPGNFIKRLDHELTW